jgi:hypothetical protein
LITVLVLATGLFLFLFLAVRKGRRLTAAQVVGNYLQATLGGRTADAYQLLARTAKARESLSEYQARRSLGHGLIANMIAGKIDYAVRNESVNGDRASVTVITTYPDFKRMMAEILPEMTGPEFPEDPFESFIFVCRSTTAILKRYGGSGTPLLTLESTFHLVREDDGWKILLPDNGAAGDTSAAGTPAVG